MSEDQSGAGIQAQDSVSLPAAVPLLATPGEAAPQTKHAEHVRDLAAILFDRTHPLHALGEDSQQILEIAALWHDLPIDFSQKKPFRAACEFVHKHAGEAIKGELSPESQNVLAAVLASHHSKLKRGDFAKLNLSPKGQREALTIAALLRIACGLDDSGSGQTTILQVEPARHEMWIVIDGPQATADAAAAEHNARLWAKIGYPEVKVMESAVAATRLLPYPEPTERPGIEPTELLAEAGRKVMRFHFAQMLSKENGTIQGDDIEVLHDMRVATRRLRAAFEVFKDAFEPGILKSYLKGLRLAGRSLGAVRDLDVLLENARLFTQTLPEEQRSGLNPLLQAWERQRENARSQMLAHLHSPDYLEFKRKFNVFLHTPGAGVPAVPEDLPTPCQVREIAPALIYTRLGAVRAFDTRLSDASIERLHALRIEFKKLRYTVEYFKEVLGPEAETIINELKQLQDHLGALNDAQIATRLLREFIDAWEPQQTSLPIHERQNLEMVVSYMAHCHAERHRLMSTFPASWARFNRPKFRRNLAMAISVL